MKHVVSVGGGLSSTMELPERVISAHGRQNVDLIMCRLPNEELFRSTIGEFTILSEGRKKRPLTLRDFHLRLQERWAGRLPGVDPFEGLRETPPCVFCEAA